MSESTCWKQAKEEAKAAHTPTRDPSTWVIIVNDAIQDCCEIADKVDYERETIAAALRKSDAHYILERCNAYAANQRTIAELREALSAVIRILESSTPIDSRRDGREALLYALAALASTEGKVNE